MERLTKRNGINYIARNQYCDYDAVLTDIELEAANQQCIDKLGQLEDIEQELGIDLITLLKASMNGFYGLYIDGRVDPNKWEPWDFIIDMKDRCFRSLNVIGQLGQTRFYFTDYGKTWTLIEEFLQNEIH